MFAGLLLLGLAPFVDVGGMATAGLLTVASGVFIGGGARIAARRFGYEPVLRASIFLDVPLVALTLEQFDTTRTIGIGYMWPVALAAMLLTPVETALVAGFSVFTGIVVTAWWHAGELDVFAISAVGIVGVATAMALLRINEHRATTERRAIERQLKTAQQLAHIGSFELDTRDGSVVWSDELYRIYGIEDGVPLEQEAFVAAVDERDRDFVAATLERSLVTGDPVQLEAHMRRANGDPIIVRVIGSRLAGRAHMVVGTVQDITELRRVDELRDEFVAAASHELRTPASIVLGFASTLVERWDSIADEDRRRFVGEIDEAATRLALLVEDVLQVTQIESGAAYCEAEAFDVVDELRSITRSWPGTIPIRLAGADRAWALGDARRTRQVVTNLLANVDRHAPGATAIDIAASIVDDHVEVVVADDGPGIPAIERERVFGRFVRLDRNVVGTGLGLYISRRLVEAQGGGLVAEARADGRQGAAFRFVLPRDPGRLDE